MKSQGNMYRATKIWNECIYLFKNGMPVKRHRYNVRVFPDTFTGEEAANWLYGTLKLTSYFGQDVTKTQVIQLLNKFFKSGIFESIKPMKTFKAGKQLYRFKSLITSPQNMKKSREPLGVLSSASLSSSSSLMQKISDDNLGDLKKYDHNNGECIFKENLGTVHNMNDNVYPDRKILNHRRFDERFFNANVPLSSKNEKKKNDLSFLECRSLQKLKDQLKIEMKKEYWKREDLKRDFLRQLITEKLMENRGSVCEKGLNENTPSLRYSCCHDESKLDSLSVGNDIVSPMQNKDFEKCIRKLKNEYLGEFIMKAVLKRINDIVGPHLGLTDVIPFDKIDPMWIVSNMDSSIRCLKNSTELPPWIVDAAASLGFYGEVTEEEKYPGYYKDVFNVLCENITISCSGLGPLIPTEMNGLVLGSFRFLEKLNKKKYSSDGLTSSTEDLITDMLTSCSSNEKDGCFDNPAFMMSFVKSDKDTTNFDDKESKSVGMNYFESNNALPTDCCYETTFTSDIPVTRIIRPQKTNIRRSKSVLTLKGDTRVNEFGLPICKAERHMSMSSLKYYKNRNSIHLNERLVEPKLQGNGRDKNLVNNVCKRSFSCDNLRKVASSNQGPEKNDFNEESMYSCYVNYGMTSVEENAGDEVSNFIGANKINCINYTDAIKDINRLVEHTRSNKKSCSTSKMNICCDCGSENVRGKVFVANDFHKCLSCSEHCSVQSANSNASSSDTHYNRTSNSGWLGHVEYLGIVLFRNELLMLNPESRCKLDVVLFLIQRIYLLDNDLEKKEQIFRKLCFCILHSSTNDVTEEGLISQTIQFLVDHRKEIMRYVDDIDDHLFNISLQLNQVGDIRSKPSEDMMSYNSVKPCRHSNFHSEELNVDQKINETNEHMIQQRLKYLRL